MHVKGPLLTVGGHPQGVFSKHKKQRLYQISFPVGLKLCPVLKSKHPQALGSNPPYRISAIQSSFCYKVHLKTWKTPTLTRHLFPLFKETRDSGALRSQWPGHLCPGSTDTGPGGVQWSHQSLTPTDLNREWIGGKFMYQDESFGSPREKINKPTLQLILTWKESACKWSFSQVRRVWTTLIIHDANCCYCLLDDSLMPSILLPSPFLSILLSPSLLFIPEEPKGNVWKWPPCHPTLSLKNC